MKGFLGLTALAAAITSVWAFGAGAQETPATPRTADPYANNADPGTLQFPLAAKAGQLSGALKAPLPGAVNTGPYDMNKWKYGPRNDAPAGAKIWNPVKAKMLHGGKVVGGTVFSATDPEIYCAMANAGYDFIWTEMQHSTRDWSQVGRMWAACPHARAIPGVRVANATEREIQHATDMGALVVVVPTVDTVEEAIQARDWAFFPPLGKRSQGGGQSVASEFWGEVPGGYRQTINDNLVLVLMIETLEGLKNAAEIAKVPGVTAIFAASGDIRNFTGYEQGTPDYERAINIVHDAALTANIRLCGPLAWRDRADFTCFQGGSETAAIARGVAGELGKLANTQGKVDVGPFAAKGGR